MNPTFRTLTIVLCLLSLSFGSAQERASYFGVGLDYPALGLGRFIVLPTLHYGQPVSLTPADKNSEFRATLSTLLWVNNVQLELLYKDRFPASETYYYVGGGADILLDFTPVFGTGFDAGIHATLGAETGLGESSSRFFIEAQPTVSLSRLVFRTRAGVNFYY